MGVRYEGFDIGVRGESYHTGVRAEGSQVGLDAKGNKQVSILRDLTWTTMLGCRARV
jgi:hypothetical protein